MLKKINLKEFFRKNGLYLGLAVCVLGIGLGIFFGLGEPKKEAEQIQIPSEQVDAVQSPPIIKEPAPSAEVGTQPVSEAPAASETKDNTADAEEKTAAAAANRSKLTKPLNGEITTAFSGDKLIYNPTLNMWLTHNGVDISAEKDTEVKSALAGEVSEVAADETRGMVVEITHSGGKKTVYCGLEEVGVSEGQLVNAGTVIGKAGTPAFEADKGVHLHFEYIENGKFTDPAKHF